MKTTRFLFVAILFAALSLVFVSCDIENENNPDDPQDEQTEHGGGDKIPTFTLTVLSSDTEKGEVTGNGVYNEGTEVTITAAPKLHFMFVEWSDGNTENPRTVIVNENMTYTANFELFVSGTENGFGYIDLDLPSGLKWATCNVGATKPEEYGNYYAWGEVEPKTEYNWSTYKFMDSNINDWNGINKYTFADGQMSGVWYDGNKFIGDNKTILDKEDDAAAVNMGGSWRMPTYDEIEELKTECTWTWTDDYNGTGVAGRIVTSKTNDNSIFLPAAGYRSNSDLNYAGVYGRYWSSSLDKYYVDFAYSCYFSSGWVDWSEDYRYCGLSVRGVTE